METPMLTATQLAEYETEGFCVVPGLLSDREVTTFRDTARRDLAAADADVMEKSDAAGNTTLL
jgi:hypothetical protein